ncbi:MAG: HlyD family efflux transporter periplasmic adaptor subunit [Candidatus Scalindua sp. AMX11]|nr:MAG: HlyD family efflux transporter periplasmic adaptor subunit [Candidatus Scalindua sp.]NOG84936.1 HlyD family efflux transporter periplasmic adaptor subunit [Planctomycetota bacterium]RZV85015.1 MAG: HlyD family efflux transporter periplasmic adaptor subunit [Candidatus Scalindua sp. SCAELEC01]TDE63925.1 MAG: HlyD family efflux transporter periplasmic adaptor subunit [Candidatus Scalindua sp. AMX11]
MKISIVLLPMLLTAAVLGYLYFQGGSPDDLHSIRVSGNIEVTDAEVSFKIPGRVDKRYVDEGELIEKGDIVAILGSSDLEDEVAIRQAELQLVQADLAELTAGSRPEEISAAEANMKATKADKEHKERDFHKAEELFRKKVVSDEAYTHAEGDYEVALNRLREAEEKLKLVKLGPRKETIEQARARVRQAIGSLKLARTRLGYAKLFSPLSGIVLSKNVEPGEYVAPGTPVVTVGALENVWLRAYINETDLGRVKVGQQVNVLTDTYPDKIYKGHISFISPQAEFTPKTVQTVKQRVKLVYRIKVEIPNPNRELKPGMPADADILMDQIQGDK